MSFFARAASRSDEPTTPKERPATPAWFEPPAGVVPGHSNQRALLFSTDRAILLIGHFDVYPTGVEYTVDLRLRPVSQDMIDMPWELNSRSSRDQLRGGVLPVEFLRIGLEFADGRTWTNLDRRFPRFDEEPPGPVVVGRGGGGGGDRWTGRFWLWPLPPAGDLAVYAEWPLFGIGEMRTVVDATALRRAAEAAQVIWE